MVHELSIVAQSIESTLSEKETIEVRFVNFSKQLVTPFTSDVVKITTQPWKPVSKNSKRFLYIQVKALLQENSTRNHLP